MTITPEQLKELQNTDVMNNSVDAEAKELEDKLARLDLSRINLKVHPSVYDKLYNQAEFRNVSIEDHCINVLTEQLETKIGQATITGPSVIGKESITKDKIKGPSFSSSVQRLN